MVYSRGFGQTLAQHERHISEPALWTFVRQPSRSHRIRSMKLIDIDHCLGKRFRGFLRQIVADTPGNEPVLILA